jgi:hypothetical protein
VQFSHLSSVISSGIQNFWFSHVWTIFHKLAAKYINVSIVRWKVGWLIHAGGVQCFIHYISFIRSFFDYNVLTTMAVMIVKSLMSVLSFFCNRTKTTSKVVNSFQLGPKHSYCMIVNYSVERREIQMSPKLKSIATIRLSSIESSWIQNLRWFHNSQFTQLSVFTCNLYVHWFFTIVL